MANEDRGCWQKFCECLGLTENQNIIGNNELSKVEKYNLILNCPAPADEEKFKNTLQEFAQTTVNREDYGDGRSVVFYKAHIYKRVRHINDIDHRYTFQFFLYSQNHWNRTIHDKVERSLNRALTQIDFPVANVSVSYEVHELSHDVKRIPFQDDEAQEDQGLGEIPGNCCDKFFRFWLIVPSVQWKFFGLLYQMYTFDIFHQGFISKFVHFFTIPTNVMLSMCFLAQFSFFGISAGSGAFTVNGGLILMIILVVLYLIMGINAKSIPWGFATSIVIFVCWLTGNLWYVGYKTPTNPWYNPTTWATNPIIWSYAMSFIQASSHATTGSLPPYITVMSLIAFPTLSVAVAWFSWPHLIGTEIIYIMAGIGYQPDFFKKFHDICEKAVSTGDPGITHFPGHYNELNNPRYQPFVENLVTHGLIPVNHTLKEIMECAATCNMLSKYNYFKHGNQHIDDDCVNHHSLLSKGMQKT